MIRRARGRDIAAADRPSGALTGNEARTHVNMLIDRPERRPGCEGRTSRALRRGAMRASGIGAASPSPGLAIGDAVVVTGERLRGHEGVVRYIGAVKGAPSGDWVGVALRRPVGKHGGALLGVVYFACGPQHGAFVRASDVTRLEHR
mmetsp:Transcript_9039/g.31933  ORF Transcript_9039/g.31933 Transcript_9039/m.31933 type:complete len:147 (-) Transcript_9039:48-488(-)